MTVQPFQLVNQYADKTVLIVDDFPAMLKTVGSMLISVGFKKVHKAAHGKEALQILEVERVDLIISDWNMPKMTGIELLRAVRESEQAFSTVPFMMLTANVNQDDVREAVNLGVSEYLIKPFNQTTLKNKIANAFNPSLRKIQTQTKPLSSDTKTPSRSPASILIVDDNTTNVAVLTELLKSTYKLKACLSGEKALEICQKEAKPDLILLDIMMPDIDGLSVCKQLKSDPLTEHIPVIFISALSQDKDVIKGLNLGAVDYITKPISPEITKARIATHIRLVEQRQDMVQQLDTMIENVRLKDEIDRIVNHDFKGPLSTIIAATEMIDQKNVGCDEEVQILQSSVLFIEKMVDDNMLVHHLEKDSTKIQLSPQNAQQLLHEIMVGLKKKLTTNQQVLSVDIPADLQFVGDKTISFNLFHNLLVNAVEAAPEGSEIQVTQIADAQWVKFNIHNEGEIPQSIQQTFFNKYVTSGKANGTGIGTYSALLSAKAQGGDIRFSSDASRGTTLSVKLKRAT
ncbi:hypothetical protein A9267_14515 [Shewanella sp. UCD-FRSSP16_17]|nr:hypothetical protein A9267_14515 [Shewanella sp. UCD-FRSSP16_17]